jgi:hypothetical protein
LPVCLLLVCLFVCLSVCSGTFAFRCMPTK